MPRKNRLLAIMAAPNVIPMADIMLVLLIIFMVITPLLQPERMVRMASAENSARMPEAARDDAVVLAITHDGSLFLSPGNRKIEADAITREVESRVVDRIDKTVYVRSDARAKYENVVQAVDSVRAAGVENIGLLTEKAQKMPQSQGPLD